MEKANPVMITVETNVNAPIDKVWKYWTSPEHITKWNNASDDWHTPSAKNDLRTGGRFVSRMESRDGKMGFDFGGQYTDVQLNKYIAYKMDDNREVTVNFDSKG